jgi:hypothetical protein
MIIQVDFDAVKRASERKAQDRLLKYLRSLDALDLLPNSPDDIYDEDDYPGSSDDRW